LRLRNESSSIWIRYEIILFYSGSMLLFRGNSLPVPEPEIDFSKRNV
jgi:hypothetical protein